MELSSLCKGFPSDALRTATDMLPAPRVKLMRQVDSTELFVEAREILGFVCRDCKQETVITGRQVLVPAECQFFV